MQASRQSPWAPSEKCTLCIQINVVQSSLWLPLICVLEATSIGPGWQTERVDAA